MPKKTKPITVLTEDELNALDDAIFAELAADEERLHQALQDPATIRSGQALSIAKTKPRRKTVPRQQILDEILDRAEEEGTLIHLGPTLASLPCMTRRQCKVRSYKVTQPQ